MTDRGDPHHEPEGLGVDPIPGLELPLDAHAGPARALSPAALRAMVAGVVDAWPGPELHEPSSPDPASPHGPPAPPTGSAGLAVKPFLLGAAVATTACLATVATMLWLTREAPHDAARPTPSTPAAHVADDEPPAGHDTAIAETASDTTANTAATIDDTADYGTEIGVAPIEDTPIDDTIDVTDDANEDTGRDTTGGATSHAAGSDAVVRRPRGADPRIAEDLLERANRLRGAGSFREADEVYERVTREHRGAFAAYVAEVASASLHLEQLGDPRGAAQRFTRALRMRPGGALDLEALDGLARARRALGDREGEREALRTLVSRHPGSGAAARATGRLADLEPPSP